MFAGVPRIHTQLRSNGNIRTYKYTLNYRRFMYHCLSVETRKRTMGMVCAPDRSCVGSDMDRDRGHNRILTMDTSTILGLSFV